MKNKVKKEAILEAGAEIMYRKGYNATGVKDIVTAAGIPKGSFYNYFESKEQFASEALIYFTNKKFEPHSKILTNNKISPLERLRNFFQFTIQEFEKCNFSSGCFVGNLCQEMADASHSICCTVDKILQQNQQLFHDCLQQAQQQGEIQNSIDTKEFAEFIFNSWEGAILRMKACKSARPLETFYKILFENLLK